MSLQAINYAMTQPVEETGPRLLLFIIAHHVNWETGLMYVTQAQLADELRASERSVRRWLDYLEAEGYIARKECRGDYGQRLPDEIELIGYLEWQRVLYEGGTIRSPKARAKPADKPLDKLSGSPATDGEHQPDNLAGSNRTRESGNNRPKTGGQPDKKGGPTGHCCPVQTTTSTITTIKAREGACEAGASPPRAEVQPTRAQPALTVRRGDASWNRWLITLSAAVAEQAEASGAIEVTARWPETPGARCLRAVPPANQTANHRTAGDGA